MSPPGACRVARDRSPSRRGWSAPWTGSPPWSRSPPPDTPSARRGSGRGAVEPGAKPGDVNPAM
jgi:hypothetical protein